MESIEEENAKAFSLNSLKTDNCWNNVKRVICSLLTNHYEFFQNFLKILKKYYPDISCIVIYVTSSNI